MPRKPTAYARRARERLIALATDHPENAPLPPLRELAGLYDIHAATVLRILRDLVAEGVFWQGPSGRFFPAAARKQTLRGAPICFIGREVWQWSRLYQEILEGVSEVAAANGSPFLLLTSRSLVRQETPSDAPVFASRRVQAEELSTLLRAVPKGCGGFLLDHLWKDPVLAEARFPMGARVQVLHGTGRHAAVAGPCATRTAGMAAAFVEGQNAKRVALALPFAGDPAIDAVVHALRNRLRLLSVREVACQELLANRQTLRRVAAGVEVILCPEDNLAAALADALPRDDRTPVLLGTQGTGLLHAPHFRLRHDYRRLGRLCASHIFHGTELPELRPSLLGPRDRLPERS